MDWDDTNIGKQPPKTPPRSQPGTSMHMGTPTTRTSFVADTPEGLTQDNDPLWNKSADPWNPKDPYGASTHLGSVDNLPIPGQIGHQIRY